MDICNLLVGAFFTWCIFSTFVAVGIYITEEYDTLLEDINLYSAVLLLPGCCVVGMIHMASVLFKKLLNTSMVQSFHKFMSIELDSLKKIRISIETK